MESVMVSNDSHGQAAVSSSGNTSRLREAEPPKEVMSKLQQHLERVQRDIQVQQRHGIQQRPGPRGFGARTRPDSRRIFEGERFMGKLGNPPRAFPLPNQHAPSGTHASFVRPQNIRHGPPPYHTKPPPGGEHSWSTWRPPKLPTVRPGWGCRPRISILNRPRGFLHPRYFSLQRPPTFDSNHQKMDSFPVPAPSQQSVPIEDFPPLERKVTEPSDMTGHMHSKPQTSNVFQVEPPIGETARNVVENSKAVLLEDKDPFLQNNEVMNMPDKNETDECQQTNLSSNDGSMPAEQTFQIESCENDTWQNIELDIFNECFTADFPSDKCFTVQERNKISTPEMNYGSPPRKDRSSSGPLTPPGLKGESPFGLNSPRDISFSLHNTLLSGLKFRFPKTKTQFVNHMAGENELGKPYKIYGNTIDLTPTSVSQAERQSSANELIPAQSLDGTKCADLKTDLKRNAVISLEQETIETDQQSFEELAPPCSPNKQSKQIISKTSVQILNTCGTEMHSEKTTSSVFEPFKSPFDRRNGLDSYNYNFATRQGEGHYGQTTHVNSKESDCPKCHSRLRWPHVLPCCHRFCFPCIISLFDASNNKIQCPSCKSTTPAEPSLSYIKLDIQKCREMIRLQINPFTCTLCAKSHASCKCRTCPSYLCIECRASHGAKRNDAYHEITAVDKVGYSEDGDLHPTCLVHIGMLLKIFCKTCNHLVCQFCLQSSHNNHESYDLLSARAFAEKRMKEMNYGINRMIELCQKRLQNFNLTKQRVEATVKVARNNIHKNCNQIIEDIEGFEKHSKKLVGKAHDAGLKHLMGMRNDAMKYNTERETFQNMLHFYIEDSTPQECASIVPIFTLTYRRLTKFYTKSNIVDPHFDAELTFDPNYPDFNDAISRMSVEFNFEENEFLQALKKSSLEERAQVEDLQDQHEIASNVITRSQVEPTGGCNKTVNHQENPITDEVLKNFVRRTVSNKYIFGKFGRGEYEFSEPSGVCYLNDGCLAICDAKSHRIIIYNDYKYVRTIGQPPNLPPFSATSNPKNASDDHALSRTHGALHYPFRLAQCPVTHNLVIVERPPSTDVQVFSVDGMFVRRFGHDSLRYPRGITVDEEGKVLVIESRTMKVFIFSMEGVKLHAFYLSMHLEFPNDIAARCGNIFVSDNRTHCVHVYDYNLEWQRKIGDESLTYFPIGVAVNHLGQVVIADNHNTFNISVFRMDGSFVSGYKSECKHANCYNMALHPSRTELAVTTKDCRVIVFDYAGTSCDNNNNNEMDRNKQLA